MDSISKLIIVHQIKTASASVTWKAYSLTMELSDTYEYVADFSETLFKSILSDVQNALPQ